jgi:hypothetical protein
VIAVGVLGGWFGYAVLTYGYVLIKGWDIPWSQWVTPFNPYTWPKPPATPPLIPDDKLLPSSATSTAGSTGGTLSRQGPVSNPRPGRGQVGRTTKKGGPKTGPK